MNKPQGEGKRAEMGWKDRVRVTPDFPKAGILFRDVLPVMAEPTAWQELIGELVSAAQELAPTMIMAPEARGFLLGAPLADRMGIGMVPVRKPGKLPPPVYDEAYALEYGENRLEVEVGLALLGHRILIVDDVLATGGTVAATARLAKRLGGSVAGYLFVMELEALQGRRQLDAPGSRIRALMSV